MILIQRFKVLSILTAALALSLASCGDGSSDPGNTTPEELLTDGLAKVPQMAEALSRLVLAIQGVPQSGVTLTPITDGVQGSVGVDLDGNGSMEVAVHGSLVYLDPPNGFAGGATLTITGIDGSAVDAQLAASVYPTSPTDVVIPAGQGTIDSPAGTITVTSIGLGIGFGTPTPTIAGASFFNLDGKSGQVFVGDDGQGGMTITLEYDGDVTTVP